MNKQILLINADNSDITYETLAEFQGKYPREIFWVNQCSYSDYSEKKEVQLLNLVIDLDWVFILKAGGGLETYDDLVLGVIYIAEKAKTELAYYIDQEVSSA